MARDALAVTLPIFDASVPTTGALEDRNAASFRAVVSTDGSKFWLHAMDELSAVPSGHRGPATFASLQRRHLLPPLTADVAQAVGLEMLSPSGEQVEAICRDRGAEGVIASIVRSSTGRRMAMVFVKPTGRFAGLVRTRYVCSIYHETYDESVYQDNDGKCPKHKGATLIEQP